MCDGGSRWHDRVIRVITDSVVLVARLFLRSAPAPLRRVARTLMPLRIKRRLGDWMMKGVKGEAHTVSVKDGRRFTVIEDRVFLRVYYEGSYEPDLTAAIKQLVLPGDRVVDVGANFGWYTTLFATLVKDGLVVACEPEPGVFAVLQENIRLNGLREAVRTRNVCVGQRSGSVQLASRPGESGLAHVVAPGQAEGGIEVEMVLLDIELGDEGGKVAFMKIDVEGFELEVLRGARTLLEHDNPPILLLELNDEALARAGTGRGEVLSFLRERGFDFWDVKEGGVLVETDARMCHDVLCAASGQYAQRLRSR